MQRAASPPVDGPAAVPGAASLPADLTAAAVREVDSPTRRSARPASSRGDVTDWLETFAPVADANEDEPSAPTPDADPEESGSDKDSASDEAAPAQGDAPTPELPEVETMIPGVDYRPRVDYEPRSAQPRGAIDWNAPLVWSGEDVAQAPEPTTPASDASAAPLPPPANPAAVPPTPAAPVSAPVAAAVVAAAPADVDEDSGSGPAWPEPPLLDANRLPISRLRPAAEPVAWGWAAAWPNGGPADWHTQSLPAVADATSTPPDTPLPAPAAVLDTAPQAAPGSDLSAQEATETALVVEELETSQGAVSEAPVNEVAVTDSAIAEVAVDEQATDPLAPAAPEAPSAPVEQVIAEPVSHVVEPVANTDHHTGHEVAWADDIPPVNERPAPPVMPQTPATVDPHEWNDALSDDVPTPPSDWYGEGGPSEVDTSALGAAALFGTPPVAHDSAEGADPQGTSVAYHAPGDAGPNGLLGSENVHNLNDSAESGSPVPAPEPSPFSEPSPLDPHVRAPLPVAEPEPVAAPTAAAPPLDAVLPGWEDAATPVTGTVPTIPGVSPAGQMGPAFGSTYSGSGLPPAEVPQTGFDLDSPPEGFNESMRANPATRLLIEWVPLLLGAFLLAMIVRLFAFQAYFIPSGSMIPTLMVQDRVLVNKLSYDFHDVNRGDVIVFKRPEGTSGDVDDLIKRVIGLSGETLVFQNGNVFVDGQLVEESYIAEQDSTFPIAGIPGCVPAGTSTECTVPSDHVFVLGDNRRGSTDGRVFGPVPEETIVGRAWVRVWPITSIGLL